MKENHGKKNNQNHVFWAVFRPFFRLFWPRLATTAPRRSSSTRTLWPCCSSSPKAAASKKLTFSTPKSHLSMEFSALFRCFSLDFIGFRGVSALKTEKKSTIFTIERPRLAPRRLRPSRASCCAAPQRKEKRLERAFQSLKEKRKEDWRVER